MQNLGDTCEIMGFVKPNASVSELVGTTIEEVKKLTMNDMFVVITPTHAQSFLYYIHLAYMFRPS